MSGLEFKFDWQSPEGAMGPELRATWAHLTVLVDGVPVTQVLDTTARGIREGIYLPLYPLAEWFANHWWSLGYEPETPGRPVYADYRKRHNIRFAREGFALPDVTFRPAEKRVFIDWRTFDLPECGVKFLQEGSATLPAKQVKDAVAHFITSVVRRLECEGLEATSLSEEWRAIQEVNAQEEVFCQTAAALGLDPFNVSETTENDIIIVSGLLPHAVAWDFFTVVDAKTLFEDCTSLLKGLDAVKVQNAQLRPLIEMKKSLPKVDNNSSPWEEGYNFARHLRSKLGLGDTVAGSVEEVGDFFRVESSALKTAIPELPAPPTFFDALIDVNIHHSPGFILTKSREDSRTFAFCRAIFEYLISKTDQPALVTRSHNERQKRNRAFAAEFLVPSDLLQRRLSQQMVDEEVVEELAEEFHVSSFIIQHQLLNHGIASIVYEK